MPRFNFTNITKSGRADITTVMNNFNQIETYGITYAETEELITAAKTEVNSATDTKLEDYTTTANLGGLELKNYSYGTSAPSGGSNGDIYDQYF